MKGDATSIGLAMSLKPRPYLILNNPKKKPRRKELVHGLCILMPLKDYDFAYVLAALRTYEKVSKENENPVAVRWAQHLQGKFRRYFGPLIRETKRQHISLKNAPLLEKPLTAFTKPPSPVKRLNA